MNGVGLEMETEGGGTGAKAEGPYPAVCGPFFTNIHAGRVNSRARYFLAATGFWPSMNLWIFLRMSSKVAWSKRWRINLP